MSEFRLPDVGEGLEQAEIIEWLVAPGETVQARLRSKRWVPLEVEEVKDFRGRVG